MSETQARTDLYTIVSGVTNIGLVYDFQKWSADWSKFLDHFKTTISGVGVIRGWCITGGAPISDETEEFSWEPQRNKFIVTRTYNYLIRGYLGLNDTLATEKTAMALAIAVLKALDTSTTLRDGTRYDERTPPASLDVFEPRLFGGTLCHYIEIRQRIVEGLSLV